MRLKRLSVHVIDGKSMYDVFWHKGGHWVYADFQQNNAINPIPRSCPRAQQVLHGLMPLTGVIQWPVSILTWPWDVGRATMWHEICANFMQHRRLGVTLVPEAVKPRLWLLIVSLIVFGTHWSNGHHLYKRFCNISQCYKTESIWTET